MATRCRERSIVERIGISERERTCEKGALWAQHLPLLAVQEPTVKSIPHTPTAGLVTPPFVMYPVEFVAALP